MLCALQNKQVNALERCFPVKVNYLDERAVERLAHHLLYTFIQDVQQKELVILCIGTDRSTGDALGPLVGSKLEGHLPGHIAVYGTLDQPVHAINLVDTIRYIYRTNRNPYILALDACLGYRDHVGRISLNKGPLKPGAALQRDLPPVGSLHMIGIVNVGGCMEEIVISCTRLSLVMKMADVMAEAVLQAVKKWIRERGAA